MPNKYLFFTKNKVEGKYICCICTIKNTKSVKKLVILVRTCGFIDGLTVKK